MCIEHWPWPSSGWDIAVNKKDEVSALLELAACAHECPSPKVERGKHTCHTHPYPHVQVCSLHTHFYLMHWSFTHTASELQSLTAQGYRWNKEVQTEVATYKRSRRGPREPHSSPSPWDPFQQGWWGCL